MNNSDLYNGPVYALHGVRRVFGNGSALVEAVRGVDLEISHGEFAVIVGPSGSGKSTLLQLLGALDRPTEGEVRFEGRGLSVMSDSELARLRLTRIGFVFQQFNLIPTLTAAQNVEVALAPTKMRSAERKERAHDLLTTVGLAPRAAHLPSQLSGGEQQRVAIARARANNPPRLPAAPPTGDLATATGAESLELRRALWREAGRTVVLITHEASIAANAPRVMHMQDGRLLEQAAVAQVASR